MQRIRSTMLTALLPLVALLGVMALPAQARADCGANYVVCLSDSGALGTSDQLHERACYSEYQRCVVRMLLSF